MRKSFASAVLTFCALCAVVLALPGPALAGTEGTAIRKIDFDSTSRYEITTGGKYYLAEDTAGSIYISGAKSVTLDLNGKTINGSDNYAALAVSQSPSLKIVGPGSIKNGTGRLAAVQVANGQGGATLTDVTVQATNAAALEIASGDVLVYGGSYTTTVDDASAASPNAIHMQYGDASSTLTASAATGVSAPSFTLKGNGTIISTGEPKSSVRQSYPSFGRGCTLSDFPIQLNDQNAYSVRALLEDSNSDVLCQQEDGTFKVVSKDDVYDGAHYRILNVPNLGTVYFSVENTAKDVADKLGLSYENQYKVQFNASGGTAVSDKYVWVGDTVVQPTSTRKGYELVGWTSDQSYTNLDTVTLFDFTDSITAPLTLWAVWRPNPAVAEIVGGRQYATIQEAVDAAKDCVTVRVLADTSECVEVNKAKSITLDLNSKTLTAPEDYDENDCGVIKITAAAELKITNGTINSHPNGTESSRSDCCIYVSQDAGAEVDATGLSLTGHMAAVNASSGTFRFLGDKNKVETENNADCALLFGGSAKATIEGGEFKNGGLNNYADQGCVLLSGSATLDIKGGTFDDAISVTGDAASLTIEGGEFARANNASSVIAKKVFYKSSSSNGYEVVDVQTARENARWVVTDAGADPKAKVYTDSERDARAYFETGAANDEGKWGELSDGSTLHKMHKVQFVSGSTVLSTSYLESDVDEYGELPKVSAPTGYSFGGWFAGKTEVEADDAPTDELDYNVSVMPKWVADEKKDDSDSKGDSEDGDSDDKDSDGKDDDEDDSDDKSNEKGDPRDEGNGDENPEASSSPKGATSKNAVTTKTTVVKNGILPTTGDAALADAAILGLCGIAVVGAERLRRRRQ